ncbi:MAG TPA: diaminopimelate decarboxylase [Kofleriaceae bacterium]|nr:diaminopimelate decarboxylase [Kofleriaceae bacterium]
MSAPEPFTYRADQLYCEGVALAEIAEAVGTPVYVYSRAELVRAYTAFDAALAGVPHRVCYAVKANASLGILHVLIGLGASADIVSLGELVRWRAAGGDPAKVVFSGVGKTEAEIAGALAAGIATFNVESAEELDVLAAVALAAGTRARIALRVNPDVDPETHPYISTGLKQNKFGVTMDEARGLLGRAARLASLEVVGVDCHIGSQLTKTSPFTDAIARLVALVHELASDGIRIEHIDIGGGLGIDYGKGDAPPPSPAEYGAAIRDALAPLTALGVTLYTEPGRVIVGRAGALVTRVLYRKRNEAKHFTIVDAAMNDLMRPALYGSFHPMQAVANPARPPITTDVVGPVCETGDFFARDRALPELAQGELLWIGAAGAYGAAMASNYNTRPRAPEVLVDGDRFTVIRDRETYEHLLAGERIA